MRGDMNEQHPRPLEYSARRSRSSSAIDAMEVALWVIWSLMLALIVLLVVA
jgi:hypothetical protein